MNIPGLKLLKRQEIVFSVFMGLVAYLGRENPMMKYPDVLWAFAAFMLFNLLYHMLLRRHGDKWIIPLLSIAINSLFITLILAFSGGQESNFWPLYLHPIFTACLYLERRHVLLATFIPAGFLSYFSMESVWFGFDWNGVGLIVKLSVLFFSAGVTMRVSFDERRTRSRYLEIRAQLDEVAKSYALSRAQGKRLEKMKTLSQVMSGVLHSANNLLTVVLGSSELMLKDAPPDSTQRADLERISTAARSCGRMILDLMTWMKTDKLALEEADFGTVLHQALALMDYHLKHKRLALVKELPDSFPKLKLSPPHMYQAILALMFEASDRMQEGGRIRLAAETLDGHLEIRITTDAAPDGDPLQNLESCRDILVQHGGKLLANPFNGGLEYQINLPLPLNVLNLS